MQLQVKVISAGTKKRKRADGREYEITYLGAWNPNNINRKVYVNEEILLKEIEEVFKLMYLEPKLLTEAIEQVKTTAKNEKDYYTSRINELNKELVNTKSKLVKLANILVEDRLSEEEYDEQRKKLITRRDKVMLEIEEHNNGDDNFTDRMIQVTKLASNAHEYFQLSKIEKKRQLLRLVFSTIKLNGSKLEYKLNPPFDMMINSGKMRMAGRNGQFTN